MITSLSFPNILKNNRTQVVRGSQATRQNTLLLLNSKKTELFGDPYFGVDLERYRFGLRGAVLQDLI